MIIKIEKLKKTYIYFSFPIFPTFQISILPHHSLAGNTRGRLKKNQNKQFPLNVMSTIRANGCT